MISRKMAGAYKLPLIISIFVSILLLLIVYSRSLVDIDNRYQRVAEDMRENTRKLIVEKHNAILLIALAIGDNPRIKQALQQHRPESLHLQKLVQKFARYTSLKNLWFQVIDKQGNSFHRSWTDKTGDNLLKARLDIADMLKYPEIKRSISTGKYNLTFKVMIPVYQNQEFIGIVEVISSFDSIATELEQQGIEPIFLIDRHYRAQLSRADSKRFIHDYYVANSNAKQIYIKLIDQNGIDKYIELGNKMLLDKKDQLLISEYLLPDLQKQPMGYFILFKSLGDIDLSDIYAQRNLFFFYILLLTVFVYILVRYIANLHLTQKISELNHELENKVSKKNKELMRQGRFLQSVLDGVSDSVMVIDKDFNVTMMNQVAKSINGIKTDNYQNLKCYKVSHNLDVPCEQQNEACPHAEVFATEQTVKVVHDHISNDGKSHFIEVTATPLLDTDGNVEGIIELGHDVTNHVLIRKQLQQQKSKLDKQAHHDALTGLPNRILLMDRLRQAIKQAQRENTKVAILFIDLDRFKEINDGLGHNVGDEVLKEIAGRLKTAIRNIDTVARLGGDEFIIILSSIARVSGVIEVAQKLVDVLAQAVNYQDHELYLAASIGISLYPDDIEPGEDETDTMIRNADSAMYQAKGTGGNNYQFYTSDMTEQAFERILMEKNLRRAIENDEFTVYYQPQYNSRTHQFVGMEALLRWQHPEMGLVPPNKFIPVAEDNGLIVQIGWIVIDKVIRQMLVWSEKGFCSGSLSINLSVKQIQDKNFLARIMTGLKKYKYNPNYIKFEITESYIMTNPEQAIETLQQLKDMGFTISIDDFGTGYSSLSYLKRLPIDELKIDQSFVRDIPGDEDDEAIVRSIISLSKSLNLKVIAEGVESKAQQAFLLAEQCENIQGYLIHKPMTAEAMTGILQQSKDAQQQA